ncbi:MAG TPA: hypothetical protein PLA74_10900 [Syntrophales bacterium]|nr:hypothetical protein [Syntrophales bacterium]HPQ45212.1 hypothetical protein [Syntrophales bacterium]
MIEKTLENIAEKILALDEASLSSLWGKYKTKLEQFDTTREWEKATIIFFIINSVRVKNDIFNKRVMSKQNEQLQSKKPAPNVSHLKRIK